MSTGKTTDAIAMNFLQTLSFYYTWLYGFKGYSNWYKINEMVNNHSNNCNSSDFKKIYANIANDNLQYLVTPTS